MIKVRTKRELSPKTLVNRSNSIVSYFLEINFYNSYIFSLITHMFFIS